MNRFIFVYNFSQANKHLEMTLNFITFVSSLIKKNSNNAHGLQFVWMHTSIAFHLLYGYDQFNHSLPSEYTAPSLVGCFHGSPCSPLASKSRPLMMFQGCKVYLFISLSLGKRADGLGQSASSAYARHIRKLRLLGDRGAVHISGPALGGTPPACRRGERNPLVMIQQMTGCWRSGPSFFLC